MPKKKRTYKKRKESISQEEFNQVANAYFGDTTTVKHEGRYMHVRKETIGNIICTGVVSTLMFVHVLLAAGLVNFDEKYPTIKLMTYVTFFFLFFFQCGICMYVCFV